MMMMMVMTHELGNPIADVVTIAYTDTTVLE